MWRILRRRLPTQDILQRIGHFIVSRCAFCEQSLETFEHVFLDCPFSVEIWRAICGLFGVRFQHFDSVMALWTFASTQKFSPQIFSLWIAAVLFSMDFIWQSRNLCIFQNQKCSFHQFLTSLIGWLRLVAKLVKGNMGNSIEDLSILRELGISGCPRKAPYIIQVFWLPPQVGWVKLNTDGMAQGAPGRAATGGVFRDFRGAVLGDFCSDVGIGTAFYAEIMAVIQGIEFAHQQGWHNLWIEMDSKAVLQCLLSSSYHPPWRVATRWFNGKQLLSGMRFYCSHIYREGNSVADGLASLGLGHASPFWWNSIPDRIATLVGRDMSLLPTYRFR